MMKYTIKFKEKTVKIYKNTIFIAHLFLRGEIRLCFRYVLFSIGYQVLLPQALIRSVKVHECDSKMVTLIKRPRIIVTAPIPKVREEVAQMLFTASDALPTGYLLEIVFAYRDLATQQRFWDEVYQEQKVLFPEATPNELKVKARQLSAEPTGNGPHQTGGAIDVVLRKTSGELVPMGTEYRGHSNKTAMFSKFCTEQEQENRTLLRTAMLNAGFWYYPGEWWHYCYGDQMWAAYTASIKAFYGPVIVS